MPDQPPAPFEQHGPDVPRYPVVLSVPHAGRDYPGRLLSASRLAREQLELLEDRYADLLVKEAVDCGFTALVATRARAWIDLNRHEREIDPDMVTPWPGRRGLIRSSKVTGGLGLLPRRLRGKGDILHGPVAMADVEARIADDHRPYHKALTALLEAAHARFGVAILLDIHSMPPLPAEGFPGVRIVFGDRFGRSASSPFIRILREIAAEAGHGSADNVPYSGGHVLDAHGNPSRGRHAIQVEIDRSLYLDGALKAPQSDLGGVNRLIRLMAQALSEEVAGGTTAIAAE